MQARGHDSPTIAAGIRGRCGASARRGRKPLTKEMNASLMDIGISIVVTFVLVLVNGYFSMSEMALVNAKQVLLQHEAEEGDKRAGRALSLAADSGQFLATIQVAITLVGFFASAAAATNLSDPFAAWLSGLGVQWLAVIAPWLAPVLITLVVSYLSIVVGELVPKRIALADAERVSKTVAGPLMVF